MKRFKPEWEEQSAILMAYPHTATDWGVYLEEAQECFSNIIDALSHYQEVVVCVHPNDTKSQDYLAKMSQVQIALIETNDTWARDFGPLCVETNGIALYLDFIFNAWGGKYQAHLDNAISSKLAQKGLLKHPLRFVNFVLEGGSVESDGEGSILTTTSCLLNPDRNPNLDQAQITGVLKQELGAQQILWLDVQPLAGDDTDGHIDTLARFLDPNTIAYVSCSNRNDPHYDDLKNMEAQLRHLRNMEGEHYELLPLPLPSPKFYQNTRLPATYANFLWVNNNNQKVLFVPTYDDSADNKVLKILEDHTGVEVVGVDCSVLIRQKGSLHCATMQLY
ncbi:agmatine deiminase family protein [Helicobacter heilmannii]|uniref:Agmatine deiminase n=1 Tax=Helicobacter heilmannii TaxID=35817 RepID=A0A0K2Y0I5_HELHE|nr:agmatine deiminase family protein [Helicobacter heilmannii]CCM10811.1 Agmatine deiminase [Helicobacter heilmannii ASB1.4]CRF47028.1 Agmatine deiminase [Helicobacter heilmannii]CRF51837.1 Agmatine deiminase [Helicobacter heilmannii]CRI35152.1 Agmatine deiminase [Helicobacter heilmannii]BDQ27999.1 agmatine deiminase [Helicobacter heilmannii]